MDVSKIKLSYKDTPGTGKEIFADFGQEFDCLEFTMRGDVPQRITYHSEKPYPFCSEPWIQFADKEWTALIEAVFTELVALWNTKYGHKEDKS